jgi:hypothetical protein
LKRNEQIWLSFICLTLAAVFEVALFHFTNDDMKSENPLATASSVPTFDLFANHNSIDLPSKNENQSPQKSQQVYFFQVASGPCCNYSFITRQTTPFWYKSYKKGDPLVLVTLFIPILTILAFTIFYWLARTNPGDDWLNLQFYFNNVMF